MIWRGNTLLLNGIGRAAGAGAPIGQPSALLQPPAASSKHPQHLCLSGGLTCVFQMGIPSAERNPKKGQEGMQVKLRLFAPGFKSQRCLNKALAERLPGLLPFLKYRRDSGKMPKGRGQKSRQELDLGSSPLGRWGSVGNVRLGCSPPTSLLCRDTTAGHKDPCRDHLASPISSGMLLCEQGPSPPRLIHPPGCNEAPGGQQQPGVLQTAPFPPARGGKTAQHTWAQTAQGCQEVWRWPQGGDPRPSATPCLQPPHFQPPTPTFHLPAPPPEHRCASADLCCHLPATPHRAAASPPSPPPAPHHAGARLRHRDAPWWGL